MKKLKTSELNRLPVEVYRKTVKPELVVVMDNIRSGHNVGSVFRTCDAFMVKELFLCGITSRPPDREIAKTAIGATESVEWAYFQTTAEAIRKLKTLDYLIVGIEQTTKSTFLEKFPIDSSKKYAVVFGNEVNGIDDDVLPLLDFSLEIEQFGTKHSLNVSVAAGIILYRFCQEMKNLSLQQKILGQKES